MFEKIIKSYALQRLVTAGLVMTTAILAARLLGPQLYGDLALFVFLAKILVIGNLGSVSGYVFHYYNSGEGTVHCRGYLGAYALHLALVALLACCVAVFIGKVYLLGTLGFALLIPYHAIEPVMRIKRQFYVSLLPDIVISIAACVSLVVVAFSDSGAKSGPFTYLILVLVLTALLYFPAVRLLRPQFGELRDALRGAHLRSYLGLVWTGFPLYLATIGFVLFLAVDRFYLEHFHAPGDLGVYMLAYQLAIGASLLLTAQNFVSAVDIGEAVQGGHSLRNVFAKQLRTAVLVGVPSYLGMLGLAYVLEAYFLKSYGGLTRNAAALGFGLCLFFSAGSVTGLAFFKLRQRVLTLGLFVLVCLSLIHNVLVLQLRLRPEWISYFTGTWLSAYGVFGVFYARRFCEAEGCEVEG